MDLVDIVITRLKRISEEIEARNGKVVLLNDVAIATYGIIKPMEENRLLVAYENIDEIVYHVSRILGVSLHSEDIYRSLKTLGIAVINPVTMPLFIVELPRSQIDREIMDNENIVVSSIGALRIPTLEYLIAKMLSLGRYPYTLYGYTLLISHLESIDVARIRKALTQAGIKNISQSIKKFVEIADVFPELGIKTKLLRKFIEELSI